MPDFPIDPELRVRVSPPVVLRRTTEAVAFLRKMALNSTGRAWKDLLRKFLGSQGRVECDRSRGASRVPSRGERPVDG